MDELQSFHYNPEPTEERLEWQVSPCDNAGEAVDHMCLDRHTFFVVDDVNILLNEPSLWALDQDEHQEDPSIVQSFPSEWSEHREDELSQMMSSCPAMNLNRGCHQQDDVVDSERRVSVETVSRKQWSREHRLMELCRPGDLVTHWYTAAIPDSEPEEDAVADISKVMGNDGQLSDDEDESKWSSYVDKSLQLRGGEQECTTIGHEQQEQKRFDRVDDKVNCASPGHWKNKSGGAVSYSLVLNVIRTCDNKSLLSFSCGVARDPGSLLVGGDYRSWGQGSTSTWWRRRKASNTHLASFRRGRSNLCLSDGRPQYGARSTSKRIGRNRNPVVRRRRCALVGVLYEGERLGVWNELLWSSRDYHVPWPALDAVLFTVEISCKHGQVTGVAHEGEWSNSRILGSWLMRVTTRRGGTVAVEKKMRCRIIL